ncbi:nucleolar protein 10 isoform 1 [Camelus ferus]|nr:nucleolar protein 10 isoform 1 [Camelus ferus]
MQVSSLNEVKIYSLSCGKSLPEWLSDRKKRALQKKDVDVRRRIELIQDFEMPTVCTTIKVSKDGQYILATGTYKPRVRCYDTYQLSLKFERCLDSEVVTFETLSDDYSKIVFLHNDRYIEFHSQSGFYYKTRIPKFGRDFSYHYPSCDLYFVGASSEVYRLNLEQGRYLNPLQTDAAINSLPTISALKFNGALTMAVGTSTGQVLLYDLRSDKPLLVKDHQYGLPIKSIHFQDSLDLILSADSRIVKMWNKNSGKIFTSLEPEHDINDVCLYPNSGMLLTANETPKMGIYYIPVLGPAPRWCSFLDNLTEELEENPESTVYDDYKFVTKKDLENLGLTHLIGSPFLRAYMHGFFMDIRLYHKVTQEQSIAISFSTYLHFSKTYLRFVISIRLYHKVKLMVNPFAYEEYRKDKIRQKIEETRAQRVQLKKLPKVNKELALKLIEEEEEKQKSTWKKKVKSLPNILSDDRFKVMFENPDFQEEEEEPEGKPSDAESSESSDDEKDWVEEVRKQRRLLQQEEKVKRQERLKEDQQTVLKPQFYEIKAGEEFRSFKDSATKQKLMNKTLEDRLKLEAKNGTLSVSDTTVGSKQLTFTLKKSEQQKKQQEAEKLHRQERKTLRRSAGHLKSRSRRGRLFH